MAESTVPAEDTIVFNPTATPPGLQLAETEISLMRRTFNQYARATQTNQRRALTGLGGQFSIVNIGLEGKQQLDYTIHNEPFDTARDFGEGFMYFALDGCNTGLLFRANRQANGAGATTSNYVYVAILNAWEIYAKFLPTPFSSETY